MTASDDRPGYRRLLVWCACALLVALPAPAVAQRAAFLDAFAGFAAAVEGRFGDEGPLLAASIQRMTRALAAWDQSIQAFESRVAIAPPHPADAYRLRVALARLYAERGRLTDAQRELEAAARLDPSRTEAHLLRGLVLRHAGRGDEAAGAFRTAWRLDATDPVVAYYVFRHATADGDAAAAAAARDALSGAYARLLESGEKASGIRFSSLQRLEDGLGATLVLPFGAYARGYARMARGEYADALVEFQRAAAGDPLVVGGGVQPDAVASAAAALRRGRIDEARALLERQETSGSSEVHRLLGLVHWAGKRIDESLAQFTTAIAVRPADERSRLAIARILTETGRFGDAERVLQDTVSRFPASAIARWWLGLASEQINRFADARQQFEQAAAASFGGRSRVHSSIGRIALSAGDLPAAVASFERSVDASPNDGAMRQRLAGALLQLDRQDEAFVELVAAAFVGPRDAGAHAGIGQIHLNAGRHKAAVVALRRAIELAPENVDARYALATTLTRLGNAQAADREFATVEKALARRLTDRRRRMAIDVLREEASLRAAEGRHDLASDLHRQVVEREPNRASNHLDYAASLARAGRVDAAIAASEEALALGAGAEVYRQLAELYGAAGRDADSVRARAMYDRATQESRGAPR